MRPAYHIAQATGLSPATVSRILQRAQLNRWRHLHPPPPVVRYEHPAPGDLLHLDIKGMTRYQQVSIRGDGPSSRPALSSKTSGGSGMDTSLDNATQSKKILAPLQKWFKDVEKKNKPGLKDAKPQYCQAMNIG